MSRLPGSKQPNLCRESSWTSRTAAKICLIWSGLLPIQVHHIMYQFIRLRQLQLPVDRYSTSMSTRVRISTGFGFLLIGIQLKSILFWQILAADFGSVLAGQERNMTEVVVLFSFPIDGLRLSGVRCDAVTRERVSSTGGVSLSLCVF